MAKKNSQTNQPVPSRLIKTRDEVKKLVLKQIESATPILEMDVPLNRDLNPYVGFSGPRTVNKYDEAAKEEFLHAYSQWDEMSREIFRRSFEDANNLDLHNYNRTAAQFIVSDIVEETKKSIRDQVSYLEGFINRLPMIDCAADKVAEVKPVEKLPLLFISHSSANEIIAEALVEMFRTIGFNTKNMFCSSVNGFGIREGEDIYDTLLSKFQDYKIFVIFLLSKDYYQSAACLNEMGAAWVLKANYATIIAPGFSIPEIKGAINPNKMAVVLEDQKRVRGKLNQLKERLIEFFGLPETEDDTVWENDRNKFVSTIND